MKNLYTMVIPSSSFHVVNMKSTSKALIFLLSMLVLLSTTTYAIYRGVDESQFYIKSTTFTTDMIEVGPGTVAKKNLIDIEFPKGHIGVKSFDAEIVDEKGNFVPLYEAYLHHWFTITYYQRSNLSLNPIKPLEDAIFKRNDGTCNSYMLPQYWGLGGESRGTTSKIPDPYVVEQGNPAFVPPGFQEKWLFNVMFIDTRGTQDRISCIECRCDQFNLPNNFLNITPGVDNITPVGPDYKGGQFCCMDNFMCKLKEGFQAPRRKLALRYTITWVDWNQHQIPLRFYILDSTDRVKTIGSKIIHDCQAEYTIPANNGSDHSPHVQKANIPMEKGGYLIYGTAHMHAGGINATLYGQDGRTLCSSTPKYGTGKEAGNEEGYVVGMSVCYPEPGSIKINDGETVTIEFRYKNGFRTGAMGHMYIYLADRLPAEPIYRLQKSTSL